MSWVDVVRILSTLVGISNNDLTGIVTTWVQDESPSNTIKIRILHMISLDTKSNRFAISFYLWQIYFKCP